MWLVNDVETPDEVGCLATDRQNALRSDTEANLSFRSLGCIQIQVLSQSDTKCIILCLQL